MEAIRALYVGDGGDVVDAPAEVLGPAADSVTVESVARAEKGVTRLAEDRYDCVVAEYDLPETDGVAVLERVRETHPAFPFVLVVRDGDEAVASAAVSAGVTEYVPVSDVEAWETRLPDRVRDAVERAETRRHHREQSRLLDQLFEQVPVSLYVKDEEGRHLRHNGFYGEDPDEMRGKTDRELYQIGDETYRDDMRVIETGEPLLDKVEHFPGGDDIWNITSKAPLYGPDDEVTGLVGVTRRITEHKESEQALQEQNERLEKFTSIVSHDLRNPLHVAHAHTELASDECDSDHLEDVANALDHMDALITDLLALAQQGKQVSDLEAVDLGAVVSECWQTVETGDATLDTDTELTVRADPDRLRQLFENFFDNAVEHGSTSPRSQSPEDAVEHGSPDVTITVGDLANGFYVADDGPGVPEDEREQVFDAGYTTADDGTGFGLNIVAEIASAHGWDVAVTDSEDGGARFEVTGVDRVE